MPNSVPPLDLMPLWLGAVLLGLIVLTLVGVARSQARRLVALENALAEERKVREQLARDLGGLVACSRELGERVGQQTAKQKALLERLNEMAQQMDGGQAITQAERLMAGGLEMDQITQMCALSQGEAALLERWKNHRSAA
jgi:electron transfer flavoprotein alpha subunit